MVLRIRVSLGDTVLTTLMMVGRGLHLILMVVTVLLVRVVSAVRTIVMMLLMRCIPLLAIVGKGGTMALLAMGYMYRMPVPRLFRSVVLQVVIILGTLSVGVRLIPATCVRVTGSCIKVTRRVLGNRTPLA